MRVNPAEKIAFPDAAERTMRDRQMRANLAHATDVIRSKRGKVVAELDAWQQLRTAGRRIKQQALANLPFLLEQLESNVSAAGGVVHWASDADQACEIISRLVAKTGAKQVVKVKSMTTEEIGLNAALAAKGVHAIETDLAELIIQLGQDYSTHIVVPAVHWNRRQIRDLFIEQFDLPGLSDNPVELARAARAYLRQQFLSADVAISGANYAVAETGAVGIVESEGNGRMCLTLPKTLISVMGIEKVLPRWNDIAVFLQLLPRSATGERMNPYNSIWTGVTPGDGPEAFHLVLLDNGRSKILADPVARQSLHCIRCGACLNICPVYRRAGGQAYQSPYPGPIGSIVSPQLWNDMHFQHLPFASTLCGACAEVCPVKIQIPQLLTYLRERANLNFGIKKLPDRILMAVLAWVFRRQWRFTLAVKLARIVQLPFKRGNKLKGVPVLKAWLQTRDFPALPNKGFREWWQQRSNSNPAQQPKKH